MTMAAATRDDEPRRQAEADASGGQIAVTLASVGICGLLLGLGALIGWSWQIALGVVFGSSVAAFNLWALHKIGAGFLQGQGRTRALWALAGGAKFLLLALLFAVVIKYRLVSALAFVIGYGALPVGITLGTLLAPRATESK